MLPASMSGNTSTLARPATGEAGAFAAPISGTMAASSCSSPSTASSGASSFTLAVARTTLSESSFLAGAVGGMRQHGDDWLGIGEQRPPRGLGIDGDLGQTVGIGPHLQAAVGEEEGAVVAQVAVGHVHDEERAHHLRAGSGLQICRAGRSTSPVEWQAPETRPSASPIFTIIMPKYSSLSISSRACSSVMPFAARSSASFSA